MKPILSFYMRDSTPFYNNKKFIPLVKDAVLNMRHPFTLDESSFLIQPNYIKKLFLYVGSESKELQYIKEQSKQDMLSSKDKWFLKGSFILRGINTPEPMMRALGSFIKGCNSNNRLVSCSSDLLRGYACCSFKLDDSKYRSQSIEPTVNLLDDLIHAY